MLDRQPAQQPAQPLRAALLADCVPLTSSLPLSDAPRVQAKCELCFPLWKPLMACVSLGTDGETALQAVAVARGQVPLKGFEGATGDTCTNDPLAGKSAESIQKDVEGASVKLELKVCIDGA